MIRRDDQGEGLCSVCGYDAEPDTAHEQRVDELERRVAELEAWLGEVADDMLERTGAVV